MTSTEHLWTIQLRKAILALEQKYNCPVWVTKEGELIPYKLLTEKRLSTNLAYVRRRIGEEKPRFYPAPQGEIAAEIYDMEDDRTSSILEELYNLEARLMTEQERRK